MYRFKNIDSIVPKIFDMPDFVRTRFKQIFNPLLTLAPTEEIRQDLINILIDYSKDYNSDIRSTLEGNILEIIIEMSHQHKFITCGEIADKVQENGEKIAAKLVGYLVRNKLGLKTKRISKLGGCYAVKFTQEQLHKLALKYGINSSLVTLTSPLSPQSSLDTEPSEIAGDTDTASSEV